MSKPKIGIRPGAVYLAAVMAAHAQRGLPAF